MSVDLSSQLITKGNVAHLQGLGQWWLFRLEAVKNSIVSTILTKVGFGSGAMT
jgi:hypothetical protein